MQGLMIKLLNVDADGERALRVVAYFDQLNLHKPNLEAIVRSTAILADCVAGFQLTESRTCYRFTPDGDPVPTDTNIAASSVASVLASDEEAVGTAWLERCDGARSLDEFILERMSIAIGSALERATRTDLTGVASGLADPALLQLLVNERANEPERSRAAQLLGLEADQCVQIGVVAVGGSAASAAAEVANTLRASWRRRVELAVISDELAIILVAGPTAVSWNDIPLRGRGALGSLVRLPEAPRSWRQARAAMSFSGLSVSWPPHLESRQVGVLRLLELIPEAQVSTDEDVRAIQSLRELPGGVENIDVLDVYLHSGSLRSAARRLNYHHSSVQNRLDRIAKHLGVSLEEGIDRQRVSLALLLWQLGNRRL